ncbi:MAG: hypothetical protein RIB03_05720 [Henriciella sp.]|uniref:hypothetical protein n=1 Tax=Henriciella sp. TaxID=1968823 RepID=UPI0032EBEE2A
MKLGTFGVIAASLLLTAACETTSSRPYKASTENIMSAQSALPTGTKVTVGDFVAAADVDTSPTCRAMGALEVAPGQSPIDYIHDAFQEELFEAGLIASGAPEISGEVTELDFSSFGTGSWNVTLAVTSPSLPEGYSVSTAYSFKTSFSAINACQNVIDAFQPTVSDLLSKVVNHPDFPALAGSEASATS